VSYSLEDGPERGISIVIPAHDEAHVLPRSLTAALAQDFVGPIDIVVVANGCRDATAEVARSFIAEARDRNRSLRVYELAVAGKPHALNTGDAVKQFGTTMYLDADVVLSPGAVTAVHRQLHSAGTPYASPQLRIAASDSALTRAYGRVWSQVPYVRKRVRGVGCFAVRADGRARWGAYPHLLADDRFARLHFDADEQGVVDDATYTWPLPEGLRELVRVRARWLLGNQQLRKARPDLVRGDVRRYQGLAGFVARNPRLWSDIAAFTAVYALASVHMWTKRWRGDLTWERAERSRQVHAVSEPGDDHRREERARSGNTLATLPRM
jgi:glycosyltransferase involved in cell wall biosynthesis